MSSDDPTISKDSDAILRAFERLDKLIDSQFRNGGEKINSPADLQRLMSLLDDMNRVSSELRRARDLIKARMDGAASGLNATSAYGQASRLGKKRQGA
jgi:hypothetical protein